MPVTAVRLCSEGDWRARTTASAQWQCQIPKGAGIELWDRVLQGIYAPHVALHA